MSDRDRIRHCLQSLSRRGYPSTTVLGGLHHLGGTVPAWRQAPRLMLVLSGQQDVQVTIADKAQKIRLRKGLALFLPVNAWILPQYDSNYELLGLVCYPTTLRLLINDHQATIGHRGPRCWLHAPMSPQNALPTCFDALSRLAGTGGSIDTPGAQPLINSILLQSLAVIDQATKQSPHQAIGVHANIIDYMSTHCQEDINRASVAKIFDLHPGYVSRLFQQFGPAPFNETLNRLRIDRAELLLRETHQSIDAIALQCGYASSVHFIRRFRRCHAMTPGAYRAHHAHG